MMNALNNASRYKSDIKDNDKRRVHVRFEPVNHRARLRTDRRAFILRYLTIVKYSRFGVYSSYSAARLLALRLPDPSIQMAMKSIIAKLAWQ